MRRTEKDPNQWYLEVSYPPLDTVEFFTPTLAGTWTVQKAGDKIPWDEHEIRYRKPIFHFSLSDTLWHTYYLKVRTLGTVHILLKLHAKNDFQSLITQSELIEGLFYGAMFLIVLFNLFLFFSLREKSYLFYCLFVTSNTFMLAGLQGQLTYYLFPQNEWYDQIFVSSFFAVGFWAIMFALSFLKIKLYAPRLFVVLSGLAVVAGITFILSYFLPYQLSAKLVTVLVLIITLTLCWSGIIAWKRGNTFARFFVFGWTIYLISAILMGIRNFGWITDHINLENILQLGSTLETLLLSLALADKISLYRAEKIKAQQKILQALFEKEQMARNQNRVLEERIKERTEEISGQNEELFRQQEIIKELNQQLILYSEDLESEVAKRTVEVTNANKRLVQQNKRLEQFAFIASHNLRGPTAQILGMISIMDRLDLSTYNQEYLNNVEIAANRLDTVIKDINETLIYQENVEDQFNPVSVHNALLTVLDKVQSALIEEKILICNKVPPNVYVYVIEPYFKNVLEHLINNAIKYRAEERLIEIHFSSEQMGNQIVLSISDNGMGIDLEKYRDKIFGLYQKFHLPSEGRGIGLYLVRVQMETMGGHIEVNSSLGEGTTFRLYFNTCASNEEIVYEKAQRNKISKN